MTTNAGSATTHPFEALTPDVVLDALRFVQHDEVFTVHSLTYGALGRDGRTVAADAEIDFSKFRGINMQFNSTLWGYSWGGAWTTTLDGQTREWGATWMANWATQATYAHESGHSLGLPHSSGPYSSVYDSRWDVMSGGGSNEDEMRDRDDSPENLERLRTELESRLSELDAAFEQKGLSVEPGRWPTARTGREPVQST